MGEDDWRPLEDYVPRKGHLLSASMLVAIVEREVHGSMPGPIPASMVSESAAADLLLNPK